MRLVKRLMFNANKLCVPIVDVSRFLANEQSAGVECREVADALHKFGCIIIKDPRVNQQQNSKFIDLMERYFADRSAHYYKNKQCLDIYPEQDYQVGATPQFTEIAKSHSDVIARWTPQNAPMTPTPPPADSKWRYFWNISQLDPIIAKKQIPQGFPEFREVMDGWGTHMLNGCFTVSRMAAVGLGLPINTFSNLMQGGPHKLAPTGSDLDKFDVNTIFAGFHYDFNFLTIHGKSRYPGLFAWLRTGEKFSVAVPQGHLLLQAGKQFEWLTGGHITCGFHQVVYTAEVKALKDKALAQKRIPWRISSTLFSHVRLDTVLEPLGMYATPESKAKYPRTLSADHTKSQLEQINLRQ